MIVMRLCDRVIVMRLCDCDDTLPHMTTQMVVALRFAHRVPHDDNSCCLKVCQIVSLFESVPSMALPAWRAKM